MVARLVPLGAGPTISLDYPIVLVGRHADCDVRIDSPKVSRRHCCVAQVDGKLVIRDLGSTNGEHVNGNRVQEAELAVHDEVAIGHLRYQVVVDKPSTAGIATAAS